MVENYMMMRIAMMLCAIGGTAAIIGAGKWIASKLRAGSKRTSAKPLFPVHSH